MTSVPPSAPQPPRLERVLAEVRQDAQHDRFDLWGLSSVIDENVGYAVIDEDVFTALHGAAGLAADFPVGNAGLLHVYGYWFSSVLTPFGYKRDRWADGVLARGYGLSPEAFLLDADAKSTLLERVSAAAIGLLERGDTPTTRRAEVSLGSIRTLAVIGTASKDSNPVVYAIDEGDGVKLITTFPVSGNPMSFLDDFASDPRLHWNAVIHGES